jgi:uncharacterized protein YabN with tetrapyrrole methylase and pyrophosphatase domain
MEELRVEAEAAYPTSPTATNALAQGNPEDAPESGIDRLESEFGDLLFSAVNLGRALKLDPEKALARANRKFMDRYARMDALARKEGKTFKELTLEEMDGYWDRVKAEEGSGASDH